MLFFKFRCWVAKSLLSGLEIQIFKSNFDFVKSSKSKYIFRTQNIKFSPKDDYFHFHLKQLI